MIIFLILSLFAHAEVKPFNCQGFKKDCTLVVCRTVKVSKWSEPYQIKPIELILRDGRNSGNGLLYLDGKFTESRPEIDANNKVFTKESVSDDLYFSVTGVGVSQAVSALDKQDKPILVLAPFEPNPKKKKFKSTLRYLTTSAGSRGSPFMIEAQVFCAYKK